MFSLQVSTIFDLGSSPQLDLKNVLGRQYSGALVLTVFGTPGIAQHVEHAASQW